MKPLVTDTREIRGIELTLEIEVPALLMALMI